MPDYRIGKLRHRVTIKRPSQQSRDPSTGEIVKGWTTIGNGVPAGLLETQTEVEQGRKTTSVTQTQMMMRYRTDIDTTCRIVLGTRTFEVKGVVDPDDRRRWSLVTLSEIR